MPIEQSEELKESLDETTYKPDSRHYNIYNVTKN